LVSMKTDRIQWIKGFAFCDSALGQGPGAEEGLHRRHCRSAGRPCSGENREIRICGGHKNGSIKIRFRGGEPLKHRGIPMKYNAVSTFKLYCIDETSKLASFAAWRWPEYAE